MYTDTREPLGRNARKCYSNEQKQRKSYSVLSRFAALFHDAPESSNKLISKLILKRYSLTLITLCTLKKNQTINPATHWSVLTPPPPNLTHTHAYTLGWLSAQTSPPTHITLAVMKQQPVSPEKDRYKRRCRCTDKEVLVSQIKTLNIPRHKGLFVL